MANLLDRSSLVLTPTAYNNGEALCIKPDDGSGDFQFSRNSAATRVNAQGLVENVQILSSNLVQNGDFSEEGAEEVSNGSFSQEGVQLVTNGDFSNGLTDWSVVGGSYASVNNGILNSNNTVNGSWFGQYIAQDVSFVNGKTYKVTFIAKNISGGLNLRLTQGANVVANLNLTSEFVSYTYYYTSNADNGSLRMFCNDAVGQFEIDNCSVREVGQDWEIGADTIIENGQLVINNQTGGNIQTSQNNVVVVNNFYKVVFTISDYISGEFRLFNTFDDLTTYNSNGTYTVYSKAYLGTTLNLFSNANSQYSITNISVKEVGQNWDSEQGIWTFGDGVANGNGAEGTNEELAQQGVTTPGKTYSITYEVKNYVSGSIRTRRPQSDFQSGNGIYTELVLADATTLIFTGNNFNGSITNISVIEITDDTNLPRINYEGFSYQDALGSELNPNTYIAGKSTNLTLNGTQLQIDNGGENYARARANVVLVSGKTYRAKVTCINQGTNGASFYVLAGRPFGTINMISGETYEVTFVADSFYTPFYENKVGGSGLIVDNISIKEYLGQEVVPDSGCGSWLFEPQSTNLVPYSEDYSQWVWGGNSNANNTTRVDGQSSPDGETNAALFTRNAGTGGWFSPTNLSVTLNQTYTYSLFVKKGTSGTIELQNVSNSPQSKVIYNIDTNTFTTEYNATGNFVDYGNGWYRIAMTFEHLNTAATSAQIRHILEDGKSMYVFGSQFEQQSYATSYIPTSGSTVTRNQDVCTNGGSLASINSTEGTLYGEFSTIANDNNSNWINISDGTPNNWLFVGRDNDKVRVYLRANNAVVLSNMITPLSNNNKVALSYKSGDIRAYINGVEIVNLTSAFSFTSALNTLDFNAYNGGGTTTQIAWKAVAVWKEALTDQELAELTTI